jgi:hypothetical protein
MQCVEKAGLLGLSLFELTMQNSKAIDIDAKFAPQNAFFA